MRKLSAFVLAFSLIFSTVPAAAQSQSAAPGKMVRLNGIEMHYEEHGSGEPLLLLHAFGGCSAQWGSLVGELAKKYRVIVPDLRGHGWSTNPSEKFTHRQAADDLRVLMDQLGIERARAMGISTGGMTLLHLATKHPARLDAIVLIGTTTYYPEEARMMMRSPGENLQGMSDMFSKCATRGKGQVEELLGQFLGFKDSYEDMNFTKPYLSTITARTLIVHGDRDDFFPVSIPVEMYQAIPESELWIVPRGGHVPIFGPSAPEFLRISQDFLARSYPLARDPSEE